MTATLMGLALLVSAPPAAAGEVPAGKYFAIQVVDDQTGRGVPLVELRTVNEIRHYTDSNGYVAFHEPGLMGRKVFFFVSSHGYEFAKDGFGMAGTALDVQEGGSAVLKIKRLNVAERLYRMTGGGIYRDSVLLGKPVPTKQPVLNGQVFGQDSVLNAVFQGKLWWFWGDTGKPSYPLGNFNMSGATSSLPSDGGLDPAVGVDLTYFVDESGFSRQMAPIPGPGPTWCGAFMVVRDAGGKEHMLCFYSKIKPGQMETYEHGLCEYNDEKGVFEKLVAYPMERTIPLGHTLPYRENGADYFYFAMPFPLMRVRAELGAVRDLDQYEAFTCLRAGTRVADARLDRDAQGRLVYAWKKGTAPVGPADQDKLVKEGHIKAGEGRFRGFTDVETGKPVMAHGASVFWNDYRKRWIMICIEVYGRSFLGELWYAEADSPLGPWGYARRIVTHNKYSFYNPKQHPYFDQQGGRIVYFEGTYTMSFSGNEHPTPRYDYNQMMYRMDLADERLVLPVAVYRRSGPDGERLASGGPQPDPPASAEVAFFAPDRPGPGLVPVWATQEGGGTGLRAGQSGASAATAGDASGPVFFAQPADASEPAPATLPLFAYTDSAGRRRYAVEGDPVASTWRRSDQPICRVWKRPDRP
ncbi:MAG: hypothetical protein HRF43_08065 [Phycisphaerae bacterium]|jgi:hypothetical protein